MLDAKYIARNSPVRIWVARHSPSNDPKDQRAEMFFGQASSIKESRY